MNKILIIAVTALLTVSIGLNAVLLLRSDGGSPQNNDKARTDTVFVEKVRTEHVHHTDTVFLTDTLILRELVTNRTDRNCFVSLPKSERPKSRYVGAGLSTDFDRFSVYGTSGYTYRNVRFSSTLKVGQKMRPTYQAGVTISF